MINFKHFIKEKNVDLRGFAESCFIFLNSTCVNKQDSSFSLSKKYGNLWTDSAA